MEKTVIMPFKVSEATKKATTRCRQNFQCLDSDGWDPCSISERVGEFLELNKCHCDKKEQCNYLMPYGYAYYCLCPVRREIYNNYGV
jgi:hypothetical protein